MSKSDLIPRTVVSGGLIAASVLNILGAIQRLKLWWFVAAFAAGGIYWTMFVRPSGPAPQPQLGPGQYVPPTAPAPMPAPPAANPQVAIPTQPVILPPRPPILQPSPVIQAEAGPDFAGIDPPTPGPPPLKQQPDGVIRGYRDRPPLPPYRAY